MSLAIENGSILRIKTNEILHSIWRKYSSLDIYLLIDYRSYSFSNLLLRLVLCLIMYTISVITYTSIVFDQF